MKKKTVLLGYQIMYLPIYVAQARQKCQYCVLDSPEVLYFLRIRQKCIIRSEEPSTYLS